MDEKVVEAVLDDWRTAPVSDRLRATLRFLEKLTLTPGGVRGIDVAPLKKAGLGDEAIADAIHVCALFNTIDRLADALDFEVPPPERFARRADLLLKRGYR